MNVTRTKSLIWLGSFGLTGYLSFFVYEFIKNQPALQEGVSTKEQVEVLGSVEVPPPPRDELVKYSEIERTFHKLNWTGKAPPKPKPQPTNEVKPKPKLKPVAELLNVLLVQVDTDDQAGSMAFVEFIDPKLKDKRSSEDRTLHVGEALAAPYEMIVVDAIEVGAVWFRFEAEEPRERELVEPERYASVNGIIVKAGPDGAIQPVRTSVIREASPNGSRSFNPKVTQRIRREEFLIGTETIAQIEQDYTSILSRDLRWERHRDPNTGQVTGLRVTHVAPGSLPETHGLLPGEVVKAINGYKVTSLNGAIAYVKKEAATTNDWLVLIERYGREYTRTFHSPQQ